MTMTDEKTPGGAGLVADRGEIDDDSDVLAAKRCMPPHMLVHSQDADAIEPVGVIDQQLLAGGEDRGVDGVPRCAEARGDAADGHPVDDEAFQCPQHRRSRQLRPRRGDLGEVFTPDARAVRAAVAAHAHVHVQDRRPPTKRDVDEPTHHGPAWDAFRPTLATPAARIVGAGAAFEDRVIDVDRLPGHGQAVGVQEAERVKIRGREARLVHVEVFRTESVGTSIIRETSTSTPATTQTGPHHQALHPQLRRAALRWVMERVSSCEMAA